MKPPFLLKDRNAPLRKYMFIKKGGYASHNLGDVTRNVLDAELICVSNECGSFWIGNYAEGLGLLEVKFLKSDCRDASDEEVEAWMNDKNSVQFLRKPTDAVTILENLQKLYDEKQEVYKATGDMAFYFHAQGLLSAIESIKKEV